MSLPRPPRDLWASLLPTLGAVLALAIAPRLPVVGVTGYPSPLFLLLLILAGVASAFHRPLRGETLGLGTAVLPSVFVLSGAAPAASLAVAVALVTDLSLRLVRRAAGVQVQDRRGVLRSLENAGRAGLAVMAAGALWAALRFAWGFVPALACAAVLYLLVWLGLEVADRKIRQPAEPLRLKRFLPLALALSLDAAGWVAGGILASAGLAGDWRLSGLLLALFALAVLEGARNDLLREKAANRVHDLERLGRAGERIQDPAEELKNVAERIRDESFKVLPFHWFHFEALAPGSEFRNWKAVPQGPLEEGVPEPGVYPPTLPGFHKRIPWQILERPLRTEGRVIARLRYWCDPRKLDPKSVDLLDLLIPQATLSVRRVLADREANQDPLTGTSMRRVLEPRLHQAYVRSFERGGAMAVILCDLDHFKRINDTYGHAAGDKALVTVAQTLLSGRRDGDLVCRYGGEEFLLLMEGVAGEDALAVADRIRRRVEELAFEWEGQRVPLNLSAGVASFPDLYIKTAAELILFADEALYEAKRQGRNRCLLDLGQGRYLDVGGNVHIPGETARVAPEPPRIFA